MDVFAVGVVLFVLLVGRKPFNIADSESLSYCAMELADCPGIQDPRCHFTTCGHPTVKSWHTSRELVFMVTETFHRIQSTFAIVLCCGTA